MLTCTPLSFFSWDFQILGLSSGPAILAFDFLTEQGSISLGGADYSVCKHGLLSGHWTLERGGETCADAQKPSALFRSFEVRSGATLLTLKARSAFTRAYDMIVDGSAVGTIQPIHPFTRRAHIECDSRVPEIAQLFSFWLAALTWRRAAQNSSNAA